VRCSAWPWVSDATLALLCFAGLANTGWQGICGIGIVLSSLLLLVAIIANLGLGTRNTYRYINGEIHLSPAILNIASWVGLCSANLVLDDLKFALA
jgi:hypothetical protein